MRGLELSTKKSVFINKMYSFEEESCLLTNGSRYMPRDVEVGFYESFLKKG